MNLLKDKRFYFSLFLLTAIGVQIALFVLIRLYQYPEWKQVYDNHQTQEQQLLNKKELTMQSSGIKDAMYEYENKAKLVKNIVDTRNNLYYMVNEEKFDFFLTDLDKVLSHVKKHIHKDITIEGISINDRGEMIIPMFSEINYTTLIKQYSALKNAFTGSSVPIISNMKVNSLIRQEIESNKRNEDGEIIKAKKKVYKMTMIGRLNPEYFMGEIEYEEPVNLEGIYSSKKQNTGEPFTKKIKRVYSNIAVNVMKDVRHYSNF